MNQNAYGWQTARPPESFNYTSPVIVDLLKRARCRTVMDLGCGNGAQVRRLVDTGFMASGCEPDEAGCALARNAAPGSRIHQISLDGDPTLIDERPFDAVVCTEVIEHLYAPAQLFRFARALLKDGGVLIVSTPYHGYWKNLALAILGKWDFHHHPNREGGHIKFWSRQSLEAAFSEYGFRIDEFQGAGRLPLLWKSMVSSGTKQG